MYYKVYDENTQEYYKDGIAFNSKKEVINELINHHNFNNLQFKKLMQDKNDDEILNLICDFCCWEIEEINK